MDSSGPHEFTAFIIEPEDEVADLFSSVLSSTLDYVVIRRVEGHNYPFKELDTFIPEIIITELVIGDEEKIDMIVELQDMYPEAKIIVVSSQTDIEPAVTLMKKGVNDYLQKDEHLENRLRESLIQMQNQLIIFQNVKIFRNEIYNPDFFPMVLYKTSPMGIEFTHKDFEEFPEPLDVTVFDYLQTIGISLLVSVGQGHSYSEGCYSLPAASSANYSCIIFSFRAEDPLAEDQRLKIGYFILTLFLPKVFAPLFPSTSEMDDLLIIIKDKLPDVKSMTNSKLGSLKKELLERIRNIKNQE